MTTNEAAQMIAQIMKEVAAMDPGLAGELDAHIGAWYISAKRSEETLCVLPDIHKALADIIVMASGGDL